MDCVFVLTNFSMQDHKLDMWSYNQIVGDIYSIKDVYRLLLGNNNHLYCAST